jgi:capsular polysaccharide transport system permease protein
MKLLKSKVFIFLVLIPNLISISYYGLLASPIYVSESRFVIYQPSGGGSNIVSMLSGSNGGNSASGAYMVNDYIRSWSAMTAANDKLGLSHMYENRNVDFVDRFGGLLYPYRDLNSLLRYYRSMVIDGVDNRTAISKLRVYAYTPQDAYHINGFLLRTSESVVNAINRKEVSAFTSYAKINLFQARKDMETADAALNSYRNYARIYNPNGQSMLSMAMAKKIQEEIVNKEMELSSLTKQTPNNPIIATVKNDIYSLQSSLNNQKSAIAGGKASLAVKNTKYQELAIRVNMAKQALTSAVVGLQEARLHAQKHEFFMETISPPNVPDAPTRPYRFEYIAIVFAVTILLWSIIR